MLVSFKHKMLEELYLKDAGKLKKLKFGLDVLLKYKKTIKILQNIDSLHELRSFKGLSLEPMKKEKKRKGQMAVRLNDQYRLIFTLDDDNKLILWIEEISKHYE
jgi:plasmid maintenance system killer protein